MLDSGQSLNSEVSFPRVTERNTVTFPAEGELEGKDGSQLSSLKTRG